jgi:hypothetical protein
MSLSHMARSGGAPLAMSPVVVLLSTLLRCVNGRFFAFSPHLSPKDTQEPRHLPLASSRYYPLMNCMFAPMNMKQPMSKVGRFTCASRRPTEPVLHKAPGKLKLDSHSVHPDRPRTSMAMARHLRENSRPHSHETRSPETGVAA